MQSLTDTFTLNDGHKIPCIGLGTWQNQDDSCALAVTAALKAGYRHIDSAAVYDNEKVVGQAIKDSGIPREEIFITTKLDCREQRFDEAEAFENVYAKCKQSIENLGVEYVDLYLIHFPGMFFMYDVDDDKHRQARRNSWKVFEKLQKEGLARSIGVSNFMVPHLKDLLEVAEVVPAINQCEYHPYLNDRELVDFCKEKGIQFETYSSLACAKLGLLQDERLAAIAKEVAKSPAQVLLKWALQQDIVILPKSSRADRIKENSDLFGWELSAAQMDEIHSWNKMKPSCWDPRKYA